MKENKEAIGYYSVIPATVLYNKELKHLLLVKKDIVLHLINI